MGKYLIFSKNIYLQKSYGFPIIKRVYILVEAKDSDKNGAID